MRESTSRKLLSFWEKGYLYIFIASLIHVAWFISGNVGILDWIKEISYFEYFKTAFTEYHTLPYFWWNILEEVAWRPPIPGTSALVANPETALFSPLMPFLYFFEVKTFMKLYVIIQFVIGVFGLLLLKRKLEWSDVQFRVFAVLFMFSPIIMQHIAVAYFTWYNFYLFPWLVLFMSERNTVKSIIGSSAVLGLVVLQGGIYIVQYLGLFFVIYEIAHIFLERKWSRISRLVFVPILAAVLSLVRLSTTATVYGDYIRPWVEIDGYNLSFFLFYSLIPTITIPPLNLFFHSDFLGWSLTPHDSGLFWGFSFIMLLVVFIRYGKVIINPSPNDQQGLNYNAIFIAATFLFIVSFYKVWYYLMRGASVLDLPLFESIKNHGIRFIMGAFFGYSLLLANYSQGIWKALQDFVNTRIWSSIKSISLMMYKIGTVLLGLSIVLLKIFKQYISNRAYEYIGAAYHDSGNNWLSRHMEGAQVNSLEFYYNRLDSVFDETQKWLLIIFIVLTVMWLTAFIINKNKTGFNQLLKSNPYFKFEMALALPLILSMSMWTNLASSVPFSNLETQPFLPPEIQTVDNGNIDSSAPTVEAMPDRLIITPDEKTKTQNKYIFPKIAASDSIWFDIVSKNAHFSDLDGKMVINSFEGGKIQLLFKTNKVKRPLYFTILAWLTIIGYFTVIRYRNNRILQNK